ncbi:MULTISPECIES: hypothetical protein [unclassified Nostoc]|uniref:hypothetical protein n=1 Tax=unclassified Nostoc TaxID=2593658 RepID=UPI002AD3AE6F|nr:hypothetical protein [Nostoc sp. DedQUE03]MDZ8044804.1 hypothetical protein [Nostoc sp. DedQUE02]
MTTAEATETSLPTEDAIFSEQIFDISAKGGYSNDSEDGDKTEDAIDPFSEISVFVLGV